MNLEVMEYVQMNRLDFSFLGEKYSDLLATRIAEGEVHPVSFVEYDVDFEEAITYIPSVPLRTNSTIANARKVDSKGVKTFRRKKD